MNQEINNLTQSLLEVSVVSAAKVSPSTKPATSPTPVQSNRTTSNNLPQSLLDAPVVSAAKPIPSKQSITSPTLPKINPQPSTIDNVITNDRAYHSIIGKKTGNLSLKEYASLAQKRIDSQELRGRTPLPFELQPRLGDVVRKFDPSCRKRIKTKALKMAQEDLDALMESNHSIELPAFSNTFQILNSKPKPDHIIRNYITENRGVLNWCDHTFLMRTMFSTLGSGLVSISLVDAEIKTELPESHRTLTPNPTNFLYLSASLNGVSTTIKVPSNTNGRKPEIHLATFQVGTPGYQNFELILPPGIRSSISYYSLKFSYSKTVGEVMGSLHTSGDDAVGSLIGPSLVLRYDVPKTAVVGFSTEMTLLAGMHDLGAVCSPISVDNVDVSYSFVPTLGYGIMTSVSCDDINIRGDTPPILLDCHRSTFVTSSTQYSTSLGGELKIFYPVLLEEGKPYEFFVRVEPFTISDVGTIPVYTVIIKKDTITSLRGDVDGTVGTDNLSSEDEYVESSNMGQFLDSNQYVVLARVAVPTECCHLRDVDSLLKNTSSAPLSTFSQRQVAFGKQYYYVENNTIPFEMDGVVSSPKPVAVTQAKCVADIPGRDKSRNDWSGQVIDNKFVLTHCGFTQTTAASYPPKGIILQIE